MQRLAIACSEVMSMPVECGVSSTLSSDSSGEPFGGSFLNASIPAPAMRLSLSAR